jgi:hypothetical protein
VSPLFKSVRKSVWFPRGPRAPCTRRLSANSDAAGAQIFAASERGGVASRALEFL